MNIIFKIVWNKGYIVLAIIFADCPVTLASSLPYINGPFSCILGDTCSDITCCLNVEPLSTYLTIRVSLEYCQDKITITVDKFQAEMKVSKIIASGNVWNCDIAIMIQKKSLFLCLNFCLICRTTCLKLKKIKY